MTECYVVDWHGLNKKYCSAKYMFNGRVKEKLKWKRKKGIVRTNKRRVQTAIKNQHSTHILGETNRKKYIEKKSFTRKSLQPTIKTAIKHATQIEEKRKRMHLALTNEFINEDQNILLLFLLLKCSDVPYEHGWFCSFYWRFYASHHPFSTLINQSHRITSWPIRRYTSFFFVCSSFVWFAS